MNPLLNELDSLLFDWETDRVDDSGIERVREILRSNEEARDYFLRQQMISAALKLDVDSGIDLAAGSPDHHISLPDLVANASYSLRPQSKPAIGWWATIAGMLLICALGGRILYLEFNDSSSDVSASNVQRMPSREATSSGVALLMKLVDVEWGQNQIPFAEGDSLPVGPVVIASGYAQIEFFCGATVVVEGPAELDLRSSTLAKVRSGRLRAHVPPAARGFSLEVDDMKVVDLGTEFGLAVSSKGANVQVFDGEVELQPGKNSKQILYAGEAIQRTETGDILKSAMTPEQFLDIVNLEARATGQQIERFKQWQAWSEKLKRDPRLITYYSFDQDGGWERKLPCSLHPSNHELDGAIVGAGRVPGRWQSKAGLEFKRPADRVRVQIPGTFSSLTFTCWVKIDSLDRWYNSLFLTDGYNQGEPHWQILDTGELFFSVRHRADNLQGPAAKQPTHQKVLSPPFWKPSLSGRWIHLATTYDADVGRVSHYLNGELLHEELIDKKLVVDTTRIGAASIGNWSIPTKPDEEFAVRNLNGTMDEFAIFAASLSAEEIKEMYEHGNP